MASLSSLATSLFNASSIDPLYAGFTAAGAVLSYDATGGLCTFPASTTASTDGDVSTARGDFTGDNIFAQILAVPASGTTADGELRVHTDASNWFRWVYEGGTLFAQQTKAGVKTTPFSVTHSLATHAYWRISESGGTVTWWTGSVNAAGIVTWTNQATSVHGMVITNMLLLIAGTTTSVQANPGQFKWNNICIQPPLLSQWRGEQLDYPRRLASRRHIREAVVGPVTTAFAELITLDKWTRQMPDRYLRLADRRALMPTNFFYPSPIGGTTVNIDSWVPSYLDLTYRKKDRRSLYPSFFDHSAFPEPELIQADKWYPIFPDYINRLKSRRHSYPSFWNWLPDQEDDNSWIEPMPTVLFRLKDRRYRMPSYFEYLITPQQVSVPDPRWRGYQPDYLPRLKSRRHSYPYLFRFENLDFQSSDPLTNWTPVPIQTSAWSVADPQTTPWTSIEGNQPASGWTPNPVDGQGSWTPVPQPSTDWDPKNDNY